MDDFKNRLRLRQFSPLGSLLEIFIFFFFLSNKIKRRRESRKNNIKFKSTIEDAKKDESNSSREESHRGRNLMSKQIHSLLSHSAVDFPFGKATNNKCLHIITMRENFFLLCRTFTTRILNAANKKKMSLLFFL